MKFPAFIPFSMIIEVFCHFPGRYKYEGIRDIPLSGPSLRRVKQARFGLCSLFPVSALQQENP
jgi:hypothetical protein